MSSNKAAKQRLIELYGPECFIDKLKLRKFDKPVKYTSKGQMKKMKELTYHHIKMKKDGGKATVENGALLSAENHAWFHQQPKTKQRQMNNAFQEYKRSYQKCNIEIAQDIEQPFEINYMEIEPTEKELFVKPFNRAEVKRETQKKIKEYYQSLE